jgi:hypothetical protein
MVKLFNRVKVNTTTTGTGTISLGSAANGFQTFAQAGVVNGDQVRYVIQDGAEWEIGTGTYASAGPTMSRAVEESSNSDNALSLSGAAMVFISAAAEDFAPVSTDPDFSVDPTSLADRETIAEYVVGRDLQGSTPVATTSGTAFDFTGIPAEVQEVEVSFDQVSLSGTDNFLIQIGTSGGLVTSGYEDANCVAVFGGTNVIAQSTAGCIIRGQDAGRQVTARVTIKRFAPGSNLWLFVIGGSLGGSASNGALTGGARLSLAAELDRVRVTRTGSNTFDAGQLNVRWR